MSLARINFLQIRSNAPLLALKKRANYEWKNSLESMRSVVLLNFNPATYHLSSFHSKNAYKTEELTHTESVCVCVCVYVSVYMPKSQILQNATV